MKTTRSVSYNINDLNTAYPELAKHFEELINSNRMKFKNLRREYEGKYPGKNGKERKVRLGTLLETLSDHNYKIEIKITPPDSKEQAK